VSSPATKDWNPEAYARFRGLRLRPALDLLAQVGGLPQGDVVDLGCGAGAVAEELSARFAGRRLIGVDNSPAMLTEARALGHYTDLVAADVASWEAERPVALIFSNAALQWLPDHARLLPRLAAALCPGGVLAVQMPRQIFAPSHRFLRDIAAAMFPDRFSFAAYEPPVAKAVEYHAMLAPLGRVRAWETDYVQELDPAGEGHPVRAFTGSTAMRPFLDKLTPAEAAAFTAAYDQALGAAYPVLPGGGVLMPFRRVFFILEI